MIKAIGLRVPNSELLVLVHIDEASTVALSMYVRQPLPLLSSHGSHFHEYVFRIFVVLTVHIYVYRQAPKWRNEHVLHLARTHWCVCVCVSRSFFFAFAF